jgi:hypothetical protein
MTEGLSVLLASLPLLPGRIDPRAIVLLEGLDQFKDRITSSGNETAIFHINIFCLFLRLRVQIGCTEAGSFGHSNETPHGGFFHKLNDYQLLTTDYDSYAKNGLRIMFAVELMR